MGEVQEPGGATNQKIKVSMLMYLFSMSKFQIYNDFQDVVASPNKRDVACFTRCNFREYYHWPPTALKRPPSTLEYDSKLQRKILVIAQS